MANPSFDPLQLKNVQDAIQSLRLYRRADLTDPDSGDPLVEKLYVDPLPADQILNTIGRPNSTFLIGRKGTGKSTLFQRLQFELRKRSTSTSAYLDIKTLFESSQVDPSILARLDRMNSSLPGLEVQRLMLYQLFLREVVNAIKEELLKRVEGSLLARIKEKFSGAHQELFSGLDELIEEARSETFLNVLGVKEADVKESAGIKAEQTSTSTIKGNVSARPSVTAEAGFGSRKETSLRETSNYSEVLIRTLNIKELLVRLKQLLSNLGIRHLYILIDDFSELPQEAMEVVVDVLLAPLNNWSDEL